jgi:hypothetical protein
MTVVTFIGVLDCDQLTELEQLQASHNVCMETAEERRKRKLRALCDLHGTDKVSQRAGVAEAYIKQILAGTLLPPKSDGTRSPRHVGTDMARSIEAGFGLERGWMDNDSQAETGNLSSNSLASNHWRVVANLLSEHCENHAFNVSPSAFLLLVDAAAGSLTEQSTRQDAAAVFERLWPLIAHGSNQNRS